MNDSRKWVLVGAIVFLIGIFGVTIIRDWPRLTSQKDRSATPATTSNVIPDVSPKVTPNETQTDYSKWTLFKNGYALPVPPKWKNTSDLGGVAVLEPGEAVGTLDEISIIILSDKRAPPGQQFTTQKELDEWSAVSGQVQGDNQKTKNIVMDGSPGVMIVDTTSQANKWQAMAWTRKDNINVKLRFTGNGTYGDEDMKAVDYIVSHFTFATPQTSGSKGKE